MSPMSQDSIDKKSADELLVEVMGLYDEIYRCRLVLHEGISDVSTIARGCDGTTGPNDA